MKKLTLFIFRILILLGLCALGFGLGLLFRKPAPPPVILEVPVTPLTLNAPSLLTQKIDADIAEFSGNPSIGVMVKNLQTGQILYAHNANRTFTPASTTKIITATVALHELGADYAFESRLATDKVIDAHRIHTLYVIFSGDPSLTHQDIEALFAQLKTQGIQEITGNVVIVTAPFAGYKTPVGYLTDDQHICYSAPIDGATLDRNCFRFSLRGADTAGKKALIENARIPESVNIENEVDTEKNSSEISVEMQSINTYIIEGHLSPKRTWHFDMAVENPIRVAEALIKTNLKKNAIVLKGKVVEGVNPPDLKTLAEKKSKPLYTMTTRALQRSDNLYANTLYEWIGYHQFHRTMNWKDGALAELLFLKTQGIDTKGVVIKDGAGLSAYNQFSPAFLIALLSFNYQDPLGKYFYQGLSVAGKNGTFRNFKLDYDFRAKSGSMTYVTALAGYLTNRSGAPLAVVIMINGIDDSDVYFKLSHQILNDIGQG
jgi:D-alanyl-D-alanine carboxypeptidase/D-alanyl-D-alanine-endopeptidase (penicillin-binding protein 4)